MSIPLSTMDRGAAPLPLRRKTILEILLPFVGRHLGASRAKSLCILLCALRSCRGHIGTALQEDNYGVGFGPVFDQDGLLDERTHSRILSTENLRSRYRWMDALDSRIFLAGFNAGEQFALRSEDMQSGKQEPVPEHQTF